MSYDGAAYNGAPTSAMLGEKLLHIIDAAAGRSFTKSQESDFWPLVDHFARLKTAEHSRETGADDTLYPIFNALRNKDVDAIKAFLTGSNGRKTRDGFGPVNEHHVQTSNEQDEGTGVPGRKSLHDESWGDAVWAGGSRDGMKAVVSSGSVAVSVPLTTPPVTDAQRANFLRQLIPGQGTDSGRFSYLKQTVRTNNAAVVAEGARKPTSIYTMVRVDDRVDTIAHLSEPIPRQYLEDASLLRSFVDSELRHGLDLALDAEIVAAILAEAIDVSGAPVNSLPGNLGDIRSAIAALELVDLVADGIVMSPADWMRTEATALTEFAANPATSPVNGATRRLFGIPVVVTTALSDEGTIIVGAFGTSSILYLRHEARVDWSEAVHDPTFEDNVGATDFERNLIRFRAEMRAKVAIRRPTGFVQMATAGS